MSARISKLLILVAIFALACSCPASAIPGNRNSKPTSTARAIKIVTNTPEEVQPEPSATPENPSGKGSFSEIVFAEGVENKTGAPISPAASFPAGTMTVTMIFTYENMQDGQIWSLQMFNGDRQEQGVDAEKWAEGESGWAAYDLSEDLSDNPLAGDYTVKLLIGDEVVQERTFQVAVQKYNRPTSPAIGPITFARDISENDTPVDAASSFAPGTEYVYAFFPYLNMATGTKLTRQWLRGDTEIASGDAQWENAEEGTDYVFLHGKGGLTAGHYTLNLIIDGQIARSAGFDVQAPPATPDVPSDPADLIDPQVMPTWEYLASFPRESVQGMAQFVLDDHIKIYIDPKYTGLAAFSYTCTDTPPRRAGDVGEIKISQSFFNETSRVELGGALIHELTHAIQRKEGQPCGCTIDKEYNAYMAQGGFWVMAGRDDLVTEYVGKNIFDSSGNFDKGKFWWAIKKIYTNCPDY
jgi:hypothetical protein